MGCGEPCGKQVQQPKPMPEVKGCGTELKKLIILYGETPTTSCRCQEWIDKMNNEGPAWCRKNVAHIVQHIASEASRVKILPLLKAVKNSLALHLPKTLKGLVLQAIENYERQL